MLCLLVEANIGGACCGVNNPIQKAQRRGRMNILLLISRSLNILEGKDVAAFQLAQIILQRGSVGLIPFAASLCKAWLFIISLIPD